MISKLSLGALGLLAAADLAGRPVAEHAAALRLPAVVRRNGAQGRAVDWGCLRKASADRGWIAVLQYCGDTPFYVEKGKRLPALAGGATDDDPAFVNVYLYASAMLFWTCDRPRDAVALLEKGIAYNPAQARLQQYLAAFVYSRQQNLAGEVAALERVAEEPGAPFIVRRILANTYQKQGRMDMARAIWREVLATSEAPDERRWAQGKLQRFPGPPARVRTR